MSFESNAGVLTDDRSGYDEPGDQTALWQQQAGAEGEGAEPEGELDPLAAVPEEHRGAVQTALAAERQRAQQEAEQRYRGAFGKWGNASQQFAQMGLTVDEHGRVAVHDPGALNRVAQHFGGAPQQAADSGQQAAISSPPPAAEPEPINDYDTPEEIARKTEARISRRVEQAMTAATQPLLQQIAALQGQVVDATAPAVMQQAVPHLQAMGLEWAAAQPEYQTAFRQALQQIPAEHRRNPQAVQLAAFSALGIAQAQGMQMKQQQAQEPAGQAPPSTTPRQVAAAAATANQAGYAAVAPARGAARPPLQSQQAPAHIQPYLDAQRALGVDLGMDAETLAAAMASPDPRTGHSPYVDMIERRQRGGRR